GNRGSSPLGSANLRSITFYGKFMSDFAAQMRWLSQQASVMQELLISWAHINSGSSNLLGLENMLFELRRAFLELCPEKVEVLTLQPMQQVNAQGILEKQFLGNALRLQKRPDAPLRVLLCGHMDTVYGADHPF